MFWADKIAQEIKARKKDLEWVDDMKTPSGRVHVGALRGVVVHALVFKALKDIGVNAKFTYVFEDHDPMDDIPAYLPREKYEQYLGMPLFKIPAPAEGFENYARYYALEFQKVFNSIGCHPEIIWTQDLYTSRKMNGVIRECLDNADEIRKIYEELYKKPISKNWYPFQVYCPSCGKVSTTTVSDWDGEKITYACEAGKVKWTKGCGQRGKISPFSNEKGMVGKLPWKVEWAAKWKAIGVTVEGAGKDHMSAGGSHDLASLVCKRVLKYEVPYPIAYEWFLVGGRKMSSSRGVGSSAADALEILPPEILRFLMVKTRINQAIDFDPSGDTIPHLFDEYQKAALDHKNDSDSDYGRIFELSQVRELKYPPTIRFQHLTQWVQMPNMEDEIKKEGLEEWVPYAKIWVERYAPEPMKFSVQKMLPDKAKNLSDIQKKYLKRLVVELDKDWSPDDFQIELYEWAKEINVSSNDAFAAIYLSLLGKDHGPKAAWLILKNDINFIRNRFREAIKSGKEIVNEELSIAKFENSEIFYIHKELAEKYPSISIGIAIIKGVKIERTNPDLEKEKEEVLASFANLTTDEIGEFPEVLSYRRLYKETGVDWHSRRPSPEALLRRIAQKKGLYTVNTCVDAYNLVVIRNRVSAGAFDLDKIEFPTILRFTKAGEKIHLLGDEEETEYKEGEIAYFDKVGGINMDFNYRDCLRTAVHDKTKNLYINVDGVFDISPMMVEKTLSEVCDAIIRYCGGKIEEFGVVTAS